MVDIEGGRGRVARGSSLGAEDGCCVDLGQRHSRTRDLRRNELLCARRRHVAELGRPYAKLAMRDGSRVFWAQNPSAVQVVKTYREPTSIDALRRFADRARGLEAGKPGIRYECEECGERVTSGDGSSCWETGCAH